MKRLLKKTPVYLLLRTIRDRLRKIQYVVSQPYEVQIEGVKTCFLTNDPYSYTWFYPRYSQGRLHEEMATLNFAKEAQSSEVIADIGTNLGWFTCIAAKANSNAKVYGFELDHINFAICSKNINLNNLTNVHLEHSAISNIDGEIEYSKNSLEDASPTHRLGYTGSITQKVKALRLDTYFQGKPYPRLIKIDVEGAEQLVLEGMRDILQSDRLKTIFIEVHPKWIAELGGSVHEVVKILDESGFSISSIQHRKLEAQEVRIDINELETIEVGGRMLVARK